MYGNVTFRDTNAISVSIHAFVKFHTEYQRSLFLRFLYH